jgi:integrase
LKNEKGLNPGDPQWDDVMLRRVYLSDDEFDVAKVWVKGYLSKGSLDRKFALACLVASEAGLRWGDIVRLRKQDLEGRIIRIRRTKGSASNLYKISRGALSQGTADELQRFMDDSELEYPFARSVMPADGTTEFQKAARKEADHLTALLNTRAKVFPFSGALYGYHVLRHSVSAKAKQNLTKEQTKALLGHETDTMYHHYGGTDAKELIAAVDAIT